MHRVGNIFVHVLSSGNASECCASWSIASSQRPVYFLHRRGSHSFGGSETSTEGQGPSTWAIERDTEQNRRLLRSAKRAWGRARVPRACPEMGPARKRKRRASR